MYLKVNHIGTITSVSDVFLKYFNVKDYELLNNSLFDIYDEEVPRLVHDGFRAMFLKKSGHCSVTKLDLNKRIEWFDICIESHSLNQHKIYITLKFKELNCIEIARAEKVFQRVKVSRLMSENSWVNGSEFSMDDYLNCISEIRSVSYG